MTAPDSAQAPGPDRRRAPLLRYAAVLAVLAGLWFLLPAPPDLSRLGETIAHADPSLMGLMLLLLLATGLLRALRLKIVLQRGVPFWRTYHIANVGTLTNNLLPLRAGEFCMAALLAGNLPGKGAEAISKVLADRLLDMLAVGGLFITALLLVPTGPGSEENVRATLSTVLALAGVAAAIAAALLFGPWLTERLRRASGRAARVLAPLASSLDTVVESLRSLFRKNIFTQAAALAVCIWLLITLSFLTGMRMLGLPGTFPCALLAMCLTVVGIVAIPVPAGLGSTHGAIVIALAIYGVPVDQALAYAIVCHALTTALNILMGLIGLKALKLDFSGLKRLATTGRASPDARP